MSSKTTAPAFHGWRAVAAAFAIATFGWGFGFYGPPIFLPAVQAAQGWSVAFVSGAVTLHFLAGAAVVANLPRLYRRFGLPAVTRAGVVILAAGVYGWAVAREPWQLLAATLASGAGWATMGGAAINAMVSPWFVRARPAALSTAYNGASLGGVIFSPLWVAAIALLGFATAAAVIGITVVAATWVLVTCALSRTPAQMGQRPDGDGPDGGAGDAEAPVAAASPAPPRPGRSLWRSAAFLTLSLGMALGLFAQIGLIAHLFSLLAPALGAQQAGVAMGLATAAAILGRMLAGWLMPQGADRRLVSCLSYAVQIAGTAAFILAAGRSVPLLYLGVVLFGAGIGNATSLPPLIAQAEFARDDVPRVVALIVAISQASYAFAPAAFGAIRELAATTPWGAAAPVLALAAAIQGLAILAFLAGRRGRPAAEARAG